MTSRAGGVPRVGGSEGGSGSTAGGFEHALGVTVGRADVDDLGHTSNLVYVRWVQEAAVSHSRERGWTWERYRELGGVFVVRRHELDYLAPSFEGEELALVTHVEGFTAVTSTRVTRVERAGQVLAKARTLWAFVTLEGRPRRIPAELRAAFLDG